jgi:hypothetical protein
MTKRNDHSTIHLAVIKNVAYSPAVQLMKLIKIIDQHNTNRMFHYNWEKRNYALHITV